MLNFPNIKQVVPLPNFILRVYYENGEIKLFDVKPYIKGSWYGRLADPHVFAAVHPSGDTVIWADGQDIAPHELYELSVEVDRSSQ